MEIWKPVAGYEGLYSVSDLGRVRSEERRVRAPQGQRVIPEAIKRTPVDGKGYPRVALYKNNQQKHPNVHSLVMQAFVGPLLPGTEVRHKNGDKLDCRLENLEYGTHGDNMDDQVQHGTHANAAKTHCKNGHEFTSDNTHTFRQIGRAGKPTISRQCKTCKRHAAQRRRGL